MKLTLERKEIEDALIAVAKRLLPDHDIATDSSYWVIDFDEDGDPTKIEFILQPNLKE